VSERWYVPPGSLPRTDDSEGDGDSNGELLEGGGEVPTYKWEAGLRQLVHEDSESAEGGDGTEENSDDEEAYGGHFSNGDDAAATLLSSTSNLIEERRDTHGDAVDQQQFAARGWTWYLEGQSKLRDDAEITGADVARLMELLKLSRMSGAKHIDHDRDVAGYAAIAAACEAVNGDYDPADLTRNDD